LGETEYINLTACVFQFPLIAIGMAALLICALSKRLPFCRVAIPGAAFIASIAYSAYLVQKLVIHGVAEFCKAKAMNTKSAVALIGVELCVYAAAAILFFMVERPFLQLRRRIAPQRGRLQSRENHSSLICASAPAAAVEINLESRKPSKRKQ